MLKKTITYKDYDGNTRTEDFYFHLNQAELTEMELQYDGGLTKMVEKIIATQDIRTIVDIFKSIILTSYGEKTLDGRRFMKSQEIRDSFVQTEAYSQLFMELSTDAEAASAFINGIAPLPTPENNPVPAPNKR